MSVTVKLVGFLVALAVVFGGAVGIGRAVGPVDSLPPQTHDGMATWRAWTAWTTWPSPAPPASRRV